MTMLAIPSLMFGSNTAEQGEHLLHAARIAERAGEPAIAAEYYAQLARAWSRADPQFGDYVTEARTALERLARDRPVKTDVRK